MIYKILALGAGGLSGLSGVHENLFSTLAKKHELIDVIDTRLSGFWKYWNALYCFWKLPGVSKYLLPIRTILSQEANDYRQRTIYYALKRTESCERKIQKFNNTYDLIFQTTPIPLIRTKPYKPHCIFIDFTMKLAEREYPPWDIFFSEADKRKCLEWELESYQNATRIFTASNHTRDSVIMDYGIDEEKVVTTYEGANLEELPAFEKDYSNRTILFVGKGDFDVKGGSTLINAFKEVKKEITDAKLIIVGSNPPINEEGIMVRGHIDRSDPIQSSELLQLYRNASIFVLPSGIEAFGIALLEAMAYKTPCIGSFVGGIPEIIEEGKTGFLFPPNDHKQLADKLILLLEDENLMKEKGEEGRKRVEKYFTWDLVVDRMTEQFEKII